MRILAIGLGGAGSRIAGSLYTADRRSSRVACVQTLAIDVDGETLAKLGDLPEDAKIYFPALDAGSLDALGNTSQTATIDIGEVIARIHNVEIGETDAIFICCGLGGSMADVAPHIVTALRASIVEPIFGLFTLPCLSEGEKRSAKAADDIERISPLLDGTILFDNETWIKKIQVPKTALIKKSTAGSTGFLGFGKAKPEISPAEAARILLNEGIVRRISLILRAGEFKADGGIELAEVVMDSGEVLNTMKGMGFITIGYAVEHLPQPPLKFLSRWRPVSFFAEEHKKQASRIVELAKKAIYNEISTPCDITSAAKALVLVAGPSHELSMKGFMTVRKWIDRSIAGLETRSGDYPVTNTKYVAIIIMLSGLENIPRITELKEIRAQYTSSLRGETPVLKDPQPVPGSGLLDTVYEKLNAGITGARKISVRKDKMLVLPKKKTIPDTLHQDAGVVQPALVAIDMAREHPTPKTLVPDAESTKKRGIPLSKPVPAREPPGAGAPGHGLPDTQPSLSIPYVPRRHQVRRTGEGSGRPIPDRDVLHEGAGSPQVHPEFPAEGSAPSPRAKADLVLKKEKERHRIEHELQRQRMIVMGGHVHKKATVRSSPPEGPPDFHETSGTVQPGSSPVPDQARSGTSDRSQPVVPEKRTVIVAKKKRKPDEEPLTTGAETAPAPARDTRVEAPDTLPELPGEREPQDVMIGLKDTMKRADDTVLAGKGISKRAPPQVRDDVLLHTELKPKKDHAGAPKATHASSIPELEPRTPGSRVIRKRDKKTEDDQ
jgi:tubulin-like protein CetZ